MKNQITHSLLFVIFIITLLSTTSCGSKRDILYFQDYDQSNNQYNIGYSARIMPNDNLFITVTASNPNAVEVFNMAQFSRGSITNASLDVFGYLVDQNGNINLPLVGELQVAGLTKSEVTDLIQERINVYLEEKPIVNVRILNFKVHIMGEVVRPGTYTITDERISIPHALSMAGDLTIFGERKTIKLTRIESDGKINTHIIDLTKGDIFNSPYYYLRQNDVIYVSPNKARIGASAYNQSIPLVISIVSATLTLGAFLLRF